MMNGAYDVQSARLIVSLSILHALCPSPHCPGCDEQIFWLEYPELSNRVIKRIKDG